MIVSQLGFLIIEIKQKNLDLNVHVIGVNHRTQIRHPHKCATCVFAVIITLVRTIIVVKN